MNRFVIWLLFMSIIVCLRYLIFWSESKAVKKLGITSRIVSFKNILQQELFFSAPLISSLLFTVLYLTSVFVERFIQHDPHAFKISFVVFLLMILIDIVQLNKMQRENRSTVGYLLNYAIFVLLHTTLLFTAVLYYYANVSLPLLWGVLLLGLLPIISGRVFWLTGIDSIPNKLLMLCYFAIYFILINSFIFLRFINSIDHFYYIAIITILSIGEGIVIWNTGKIRTVFTGIKGVAYYNFVFACIVLLVVIQGFLTV